MKRLAALASSLVFVAGLLFGVTTAALVSSAINAPSAQADSTYCSTIGSSMNCTGPNGSTYCSTIGSSMNCTGSGGSTYCSKIGSSMNCTGSGGSTYCSSIGSSMNCTGSGGSTYCSSIGSSMNCTGSGSALPYLPKPTPTPTKTYSYSNPTPTPTKTYSYSNPTPTAAAKSVSTKRVCVTSSGLSESCKDYPDFYIEYCSASSGGPLQWKSGTSWTKLWDITGVKNSRCTTSSNPYYTVLQGQLNSPTAISLRVVTKAVNGVVPAPDLFEVKVK